MEEEPKLKSKNAKEFWNKYIGADKTQEDNNAFAKAIIKYLDEKRNIMDEKEVEDLEYYEDTSFMKKFAKMCVNYIFWPLTENRQNPGWVDKSCIAFAMQTFGPWNTLFESINLNMQDRLQTYHAVQFFYGRTTKKDCKRILKQMGDYLLRYGDGDGLGALVLSWAKQGRDDNVQIRHETIFRRNLKSKGVVWTWKERIADFGKMKTITHDFDNIGAFMNDMGNSAQQRRLITPKMVGSVYDQVLINDKSHGSATTELSKAKLKESVDMHIKSMGLSGN